MVKMVGEAYDKALPGNQRSAHVGMAASNVYLFLQHVLPRAIKAHGGVNAEALRRAALEIDLKEGGTMLGFGVKFNADGPLAGQNDRALPVVIEYTATGSDVVWPKSLAKRPPTLPLPAGNPYTTR